MVVFVVKVDYPIHDTDLIINAIRSTLEVGYVPEIIEVRKLLPNEKICKFNITKAKCPEVDLP